jgi:2-hydroxychromene-2-carboxylate isomerase
MTGNTPPSFPPNTLQLMRALCCVDDHGQNQDKLCRVLERLYSDFWVDHIQVAQTDVFAPILKEVLGSEEAGKGTCVP